MASIIEDVTVCIPWRAQPQRVAAFKIVTQWWEEHGFKISLGDSSHETFNVSAARNRAVQKAGTRLVIIADADTIPDYEALRAGLRRIVPGEIIYPFNRYRYLDHGEATVETLSLGASKEWTNSVGGLFIIDRQTYWDFGGQDEGFHRWGYEDNAFHMVAETLGRVIRLAGTVNAFGHEADRDLTTKNPGRNRIELYRFARRKPEIMRELIRK